MRPTNSSAGRPTANWDVGITLHVVDLARPVLMSPGLPEVDIEVQLCVEGTILTELWPIESGGASSLTSGYSWHPYNTIPRPGPTNRARGPTPC